MYLDFIMHVRNIICVQFINDNLVRQLDLIEAKNGQVNNIIIILWNTIAKSKTLQ